MGTGEVEERGLSVLHVVFCFNCILSKSSIRVSVVSLGTTGDPSLHFLSKNSSSILVHREWFHQCVLVGMSPVWKGTKLLGGGPAGKGYGPTLPPSRSHWELNKEAERPHCQTTVLELCGHFFT